MRSSTATGMTMGRRPNGLLGLSLKDRTILLCILSDIISWDSLSRMRPSLLALGRSLA